MLMMFMNWFLVSCSVFGCLYLILSLVCVWITERSAALHPRRDHEHSVTLLKPIAEGERDLIQKLSSFLTQEYQGPIELLLSTHSTNAQGLVEMFAFQKQFRGHNVRLAITAHRDGHNRKIRNLLAVEHLISHDYIVLSDSDITVPPHYLSTLMHELNDARVSCVTCAYHGSVPPGNSVVNRLATLGIDAYFLPNVLLANRLRLAQPCMGATIALKTELLKAVGGFNPFKNVLADDYQIGQEMQRYGTVILSSCLVEHEFNHRSWKSFLLHESRWYATLRVINPWNYIGFSLSFPTFYSLLLFFTYGFTLSAMLLCTISIVLRLCLYAKVTKSFKLKRHPLILLIMRELLNCIFYSLGWSAKRISWQGVRFNLTRRGELETLDCQNV